MGAEAISSTVRRDSGSKGPSNVCDDCCPDEADVSNIVFDGERTKCEADELCEKNRSSTLVKNLIGKLRPLLYLTDSIRKIRWLLFLNLFRRVDIGCDNCSVGSYYS